MFFNNRKGVSEVVANVLIVLLVIVGIAVVWSVVKPTIDKSAQGITKANDCFAVKLEPVSCTVYTPGASPPACSTYSTAVTCGVIPGCTWGATCTGTPAAGYQVVVKRGTGAGAVGATEVIFEDSSGARSVQEQLNVVSLQTELATQAYGVPSSVITGLSGTYSVNVAPKVGGQICDILSAKVQCN